MTARRETALIAAIAALGVLATYATAGLPGLLWDDYLVLRPHSWAELRAVWHGPAEPTGLLPAFYRPLSIWADAAAFSLFKFNEPWLFAAALTQLAAGAWLIGEFVRREIGRWALGAFAAAAYLAHPSVSTSAASWWFEQNHRLSLICIAMALMAWQRRRHAATFAAWWPVHIWILAGTLFKEDAALVWPILLLWQWWRARMLRDVLSPTLRMAMLTGGLAAAWFVARWYALGTIGGTPIGAFDGTLIDAVHHGLRGVWLTFVVIRMPFNTAASTPHAAATVMMAAMLTAAAALWCSGASARSRLLIGYGLMSAAVFNTVLVVATGPTRWHLLSVGAALFLAGIAAGLLDRWPSHSARNVVEAYSAMLLTCLSAASRHNMVSYRPCTPANLRFDQEWIRFVADSASWKDAWFMAWMEQKIALCASGNYRPAAEVIPNVLNDAREGIAR